MHKRVAVACSSKCGLGFRKGLGHFDGLWLLIQGGRAKFAFWSPKGLTPPNKLRKLNFPIRAENKHPLEILRVFKKSALLHSFLLQQTRSEAVCHRPRLPGFHDTSVSPQRGHVPRGRWEGHPKTHVFSRSCPRGHAQLEHQWGPAALLVASSDIADAAFPRTLCAWSLVHCAAHGRSPADLDKPWSLQSAAFSMPLLQLSPFFATREERDWLAVQATTQSWSIHAMQSPQGTPRTPKPKRKDVQDLRGTDCGMVDEDRFFLKAGLTRRVLDRQRRQLQEPPRNSTGRKHRQGSPDFCSLLLLLLTWFST